MAQAPTDVQDLFGELEAFITALGADVQKKTTRYYYAYRRIKNFVCVEVQPQPKLIVLTVKVDPDSVKLEQGFTRDMRGIGHYGTGDLEIRIGSRQGLEKAKPFILASYEVS